MTRVQLTWERKPSQPAADRLRRVVKGSLASLGTTDGEVHILITGDERLRELNRAWRSLDAATDVLSFPDGDRLPSGSVFLGEVAVSLDTARVQASALGHDEVRELEELVLHGVLHLLGYDHDRDDGEMDELELKLRGELL